MSTNKKYITLQVENNIAEVIISRESKLNALNKEVLEELSAVFEDLRHDKAVLGIILTGAGEKAFVAGADIGSMSEMSVDEGRSFAEFGQAVTLIIENFSKPVIAAVNGYALGGGCEVALSADFIYATENAVFALPEVSLGLIPGFGGTQRLAKIIGRNRAKEMIFTGKNISAHEALQMNLVIAVFGNKDEMLSAARKTLSKIFRNSPFAIDQAKKVINSGVDLPIERGLKMESETFGSIFSSYDMKEGTKAFTEKRKPQFKGE